MSSLSEMLEKFEEDFWEAGYRLHYVAKKLFDLPFFWDENDKFSPVAKGINQEAFYKFIQWKIDNGKVETRKAPRQLLREFGIEIKKNAELTKINKTHLGKIVKADEVDEIEKQDRILISIGFAQIAYDGMINPKILNFVVAALARLKSRKLYEEEISPEKLKMRKERCSQLRERFLKSPVEGKEAY